MATDNQKQVVVWKAPTTRLPSVGEFLPTLLPKQKVPVTPVVHNPNEVVTFEGKPVESYEICNRIFVMEKPENETRTTFTRATVGGRRLKYVLDVIQQPKKARACGNGPRSSSDRRPVDPPPVIALNIFDVHSGEEVTMSYDAGFMLFASLEIARPIAQGKMAPTPTAMPVLSGVCVSSPAYLDKPSKAGYFIFPDLSVRHEGWYRLKFSLFEQPRQAADADLDNPFTDDVDSPYPVPHESMQNRAEVVSYPFQVFSAKKFPGLDQSTPTSKALADQGCRVRIRREIRQRKMRVDEEKPEPRNETPEWQTPGHSRAASRTSMDGRYLSVDPMRRPSLESMYQPRPVPSRTTSIASLTHPSPTSPVAPPLQSMRPPMYRGYEQPPPPASYQSRYPHYYSREEPVMAKSDLKLPPINMNPMTAPPPQRQLYNLPEPTSTKRAPSRSFNDDYTMKQGLRPDQPPRYEPVNHSGHIEPDNAVSDDEGDRDHYSYARANGNRGMKVHDLLS